MWSGGSNSNWIVAGSEGGEGDCGGATGWESGGSGGSSLAQGDGGSVGGLPCGMTNVAPQVGHAQICPPSDSSPISR